MSAQFSDYKEPIVKNISSDLEVIRNRTFDEIAVSDHASIERTLPAADIQLFAGPAPTASSSSDERTRPSPP